MSEDAYFKLRQLFLSRFVAKFSRLEEVERHVDCPVERASK